MASSCGAGRTGTDGDGFRARQPDADCGNHGDGSVSAIDMQDGKELKRFQAGAGIESMT